MVVGGTAALSCSASLSFRRRLFSEWRRGGAGRAEAGGDARARALCFVLCIRAMLLRQQQHALLVWEGGGPASIS